METLRQALINARCGNIVLNTPYAASDLHLLIIEEFGLCFDTVRLQKVEFADIVFSIKDIVFNFTFNPGHQFTLQCRHMESIEWNDIEFQRTDDDILNLIRLVRKYVLDTPPSPYDS